jgi:zinc protease
MRRLFSFFVMALSALAQVTPTAKPAAKAAATIPGWQQLSYGPLREVTLPKVEEFTLSNGMKVYLLENHELPLIGGFALVKTGGVFDPKGKEGLAELSGEVMRTGGTKERKGEELDAMLENIAASVESNAGDTSASVSFNTLKENLDAVLPVFRDVMTQPEFRQDKLDLIKTQARSAISRRNDEAGGIASREFGALLFGKDDPYTRETEYASLDAISREDLVAYHQRYFFPANIRLAISGDFNAAEMKSKLETLFASWKPQQAPVPDFPAVSRKFAPGVYVAEKEDVTQTSFRIGHMGSRFDDPDYAALNVTSALLGEGFSSRLLQKIRSDMGLAYTVGSDWGANYERPGLFTIYGSTKLASTTDAIEASIKEVSRLRTEAVSSDELRSAKDRTLNAMVFSFDQPAKTLNRYVLYDYYGYPRDFLQKYKKAVDSLTIADIQRVAQKHLTPDKFTILAVGKSDEFKRPLTELGLPVKKLDISIPTPKAEAAAASAESKTRGKAELARIVAALGGDEKLRAIREVSISAEAELSMGPSKMKAKQSINHILGKAYRQENELPIGKITAFFDGKSGWLAQQQAGGPVQSMPIGGPVLEQVRGQLFREYFTLLGSNADATRDVIAVEPGVLEIRNTQGMTTRLLYDAATGMPKGQQYSAPGNMMGGAAATVEEQYSDFRAVEGFQIPFATTTRQGQQTGGETKYTDVKLNKGMVAEELAKKP